MAQNLDKLKTARDAQALAVETLRLKAEKAALVRFNKTQATALSGGYRHPARVRGHDAVVTTPWREGSRKLGGGGDYHLSSFELTRLRAACRDACRNNPIAAGLKARAAQLTVGNGLRFKSLSIDAGFNTWLEAEVNRRFESAVVSGRYSQLELDLWLAGEPIDGGDCFLNLIGGDDPDAGLVQMLEAEEVTPGNAAALQRAPYGVERDYAGRLTSIYSRPFPVGSPGGRVELPAGTVDRVDGAFVLVSEHLPRKSLTRGVPEIAPSINTLDELWSMLKAVLDAAELAAKLPIFTQSQSPAATKYNMPGAAEADLRSGVEPGEAKVLELPEGASLTHLDSTGEIKAVPSTHPQQQIPDYVRMMARVAGAPLGVPIELVLMDLLGISYSGARSLIYMAFENAAPRRNRVKRVKAALVRWWMPAMLFDYRRTQKKAPPADALSFTFRDPSRLSLDPLKEAQANKLNVDNNFATKASVQEDAGFDPDACDEQRAREIERDAELGITPAAVPGSAPAGAGAGLTTETQRAQRDSEE